MATLLADPKLADKAVAANSLVAPGSPPAEQDGENAEPALCDHPDQMEALANYIAGEMKNWGAGIDDHRCE